MNILITSTSFPSFKNRVFDGKFVLSEAMAYAENGANVKVLTPHFCGSDKVEKINEKITVLRFQYFMPKRWQNLKKPGVPLYNQRSFVSVIQIPFFCLFFIMCILKHAVWADIIHAEWTVTAFLALPAKWILGKKIVLTARGSDLRLLPVWMNRFIYRQADAAIDCFGPQPWNDEIKREFSANFLKLPLIVHDDASGIMPEDMKAIVDGKPDVFVILYVGRFDYLKIRDNHLPLINLIHVSSILKARDMNFHLFYIGDGDKGIKREMTNLISRHHLHDCITLLGVKLNVPDYIRFCHMGVGGIAFNGVSQEFTIAGKPQVLVKGKDNENMIWRHGTNAVFFEPGDESDLAEKLVWAMNNRVKAAEVGQNAMEAMCEYIVDSKKGGSLYLKAFERITGGARR